MLYILFKFNLYGIYPAYVYSKAIVSIFLGNLYITNVQKKDEQGGRTYVCQAENESTRSAAKGSDKVLKVIESPGKFYFSVFLVSIL